MPNKMNFEEAMAELEAVAARLESGSLSLDASILEFERAVGLIRLCESKLTDAKQRVKMLAETDDGEVIEKPFICDTDDET